MTKYFHWFIVLFVFLACIPTIGLSALFDWDEVNFAECAREMIVSKDYFNVTINFQAFWEKPPLFIWMQALSMLVFGINEFAARFPNVIAAVFTLLALYRFGKEFFGEKFGIAWSALYACSILPFMYFNSGIIDPWFNFFIFSGIIHFYKGIQVQTSRNFILSGLFIGLAILTKGPVAILLIGGAFAVYFLFNRFKDFPSFGKILLFLLTTLLIGSLWFILLFATGHQEIIQEFITYQVRLFQTQDAGHGGPLYYHWIILLFGVFPASFFLIGYLRNKEIQRTSLDIIMHGMLWFTLILFSIVKTKIVHYSSFCYFPITYLAARFVIHQWENGFETNKRIHYFILSFLVLLAFVFGILGYLVGHTQLILDNIHVKDPFAVQAMKETYSWSLAQLVPFVLLTTTIVLSFSYLRKDIYVKYYLSLGIGIIISLVSLNAFVVPKIEDISQGAAIDFYKHHQHEDAYFTTLGFKSYAHLFYGNSKPGNEATIHEQKIATGFLSKPAYFVVKIQQRDEFMSIYPELKQIGAKGGFVFLKRSPTKPECFGQ
ncbi:MAG: glycosyltransferase family 39 protein [Crocinitomicaceae bacterium]|nr:glycosyltransferase family 39 protein [Crocinitomicaceae bacterium]MBP6032878.1 glycosyltransferase family 39 protein [Crocinitomicaceae bacterium]